CAADRALRALCIRPLRARFHEAHVDLEMRPGAAGKARPPRDRARPRRRAGGACALGRDADEAREMSGKGPRRLVSVTLDEASIGRANPDVEHERAIAIYDLLEENKFDPLGDNGGPYALKIGLMDRRLVFEVTRP